LNQIARFSIGGIAILLLGVAVPIYYDSLTFIFGAASVALIARSTFAIQAVTKSSSLAGVAGSISFKEKFLEGLRFIRASRFLVELIALAIVLNFFAGGVQTMLAPYSKLTIHGNAGTYGALLAALSIGTVLGSVLVGKIESRKYVGKLLFIGVLGAGASVALIGLTTQAVFAFGLMLAIGVSLALANLPLQVLVQARVPGDMLGRVFTSLGALVTIATPVAALVTGTVASSLSIGSTLLLYGGLMVLVTAGSYFIFGEVRQAKY
jgi:Transmembrane secretion effector